MHFSRGRVGIVFFHDGGGGGGGGGAERGPRLVQTFRVFQVVEIEFQGIEKRVFRRSAFREKLGGEKRFLRERETLLYYDERKRYTSPPLPLPSVERTSFFLDLLSPSGLQLPSDDTETEASKGSSSELSMGGSTRNERAGKELTGLSVMRPPALKISRRTGRYV